MSSPFDKLTAGPGQDLAGRVRAAAAEATAAGGPRGADRAKLERLTTEFESMLLNQVLTKMRNAGKWDEEGGEGDGFGSNALFEALDTEFSKQMSAAQGFGLSRQLMDAFDRLQGLAPDTAMSPAATGVARLTPAPDTLTTVDDALNAVGTPKAQLEVTSGFGMRRDPMTGLPRFHKGIDLRAAYGQEVSAALGGTVTFSGTQGDYGTTVVVEHANGMKTRYAHLSSALVAAGDTVAPGMLIGRAGSSGRATGPHVHVEVTDRQGRHLDPAVLHSDGH